MKNQKVTSHKLTATLYLNRAEVASDARLDRAPSSAPARTNHCVVVDCSGSMSGDMARLREHLKSKLRTLVAEDDTLSLVWFSSKGQCGIVFEGQRVSNLADLSAVEKTIDRWIKPIALTGFVEPLQLASEIALRLEGTRTPRGSVASLFFMSDGMDNQWPRAKVLEQAKLAGQAFASVTFVEYGYYADRALLSQMASEAGGAHIFAQGLAEYTPAFEKALKGVPVADRRLFSVPSQLANNTNKTGAIGGICFVRSGSDLLTFSVSPERETSVPAHLDAVYWLSESPATAPAVPSGEPVRSLAWAEPTYAALSLFSVRAEPAVVRGILRALADVRFIDAFSGCFGKQRYSAFSEAALKAACDPSVRWVGGIDENHMPRGDAFTVLDMLKLLAADPEARILFDHPAFKYARIGRARIDASVALTDEEQAQVAALQKLIAGTKDGSKITKWSAEIAKISQKPEPLKFVADAAPDGIPLSGLVYNEETPNVSVLVVRKGYVDLTSAMGARTDLRNVPMVFTTFQFRSYAIVKDGLLNVDVLPARISQETMTKLFQLHKDGLIPDSLVKVGGDTCDGAPVCVLQLATLPLVNDNDAANVSAKEMFEAEFRLLGIQAAQKVYKSALAELVPTKESKTFVQLYGQAGADFLRDLGFTDYSGFNPKVRLEEARDYYMAKELSVKLKGFSSLPSYAEFKKQVIAGKLNGPGKLMAPAHGFVEIARARLQKHPERLADWLKAEERMLDTERRQLLEDKARRVFSLILGQGWFTECPDVLEPAKMALTLTTADAGLFADLQFSATMGERKVEI